MAEIGADRPLVGQVGSERALAADGVAPRAAILHDPLVAGLELLGLGDVGDLMVALHAARLDEPLRQHGIVPVMDLLPAVLFFPVLFFLEVCRRMRSKREIGARALTAVADGAAESVDRMRAVAVEVEPGGHHLPLEIDRGRARGQEGVGSEDLGHRLAAGVLVVTHLIDALVAGGAAIIARHVLEVVVDRQIGQADLQDLGRWGGHVDPGQAAEPGQQAEVLGLLLLEQPLDPVGLAGQLLAILDQVIDIAQQLLLLIFFQLELGLGFLELARQHKELLLGLGDGRVQVDARLALLVALDHAVVEAAQAIELGLLELPLGVELLGLCLQCLELLVEPVQVGRALGRPLLGLLDLPVELVDLVLDLAHPLLESRLLDGLQLLAFNDLEFALDLLPRA